MGRGTGVKVCSRKPGLCVRNFALGRNPLNVEKLLLRNHLSSNLHSSE